MTALRDWTHLVTDIAERGLERTRSATAEELVELARELDIVSCEKFNATYRIAARGGHRYTLSGNLEAGVTQACVVSLEPVAGRVAESFEIELAPAETMEDDPPVIGDREVSSVPDIEPIEDGRIAVGDILFGVLSAALNPYPRKDGAAFDWKDAKADGAAGPFAALAGLKPRE